jgi:hypothetical protein
MVVDHLCLNKGCVNPAHMEIVTRGENCRRATTTVVGINIRKTECPRGHPLDEGSAYRDKLGKRHCRICRAAALRRLRARRKDAS